MPLIFFKQITSPILITAVNELTQNDIKPETL